MQEEEEEVQEEEATFVVKNRQPFQRSDNPGSNYIYVFPSLRSTLLQNSVFMVRSRRGNIN